APAGYLDRPPPGIHEADGAADGTHHAPAVRKELDRPQARPRREGHRHQHVVTRARRAASKNRHELRGAALTSRTLLPAAASISDPFIIARARHGRAASGQPVGLPAAHPTRRTLLWRSRRACKTKATSTSRVKGQPGRQVVGASAGP